MGIRTSTFAGYRKMSFPVSHFKFVVPILVFSQWILTAPSLSAQAVPAATDQIGLLGHWDFDDDTDGFCRDWINRLDGRIVSGVTRVEGVFQSAVELKEAGVIRVTATPALHRLNQFGISVWVRPTELGRFRELFRKEDGDRRLLFSFQENGTILSLGLNITGTGYGELDAPVDPRVLLDGRWHHAAGTFDGRTMRVFLDGLEIATLERPGRLVCGETADAFIGSSSGAGEFFQGRLDDLRLWSVAPDTAVLRELYESGLQMELTKERQSQNLLEQVYREASTFAATLAATRANLLKLGQKAPDALERLIAAKLAGRFDAESREFYRITQRGIGPYLSASDNQWNEQTAGRLLELALEYLPLTDSQWSGLSQSERDQWNETLTLQKRFEQLKARGAEATSDPAWVGTILAAGRSVVERPSRYEAVAPYVKPYTPETRDYTQAEAHILLQRDWLHQADGKITAESVRREIHRAYEVATRIQQGTEKVDLAKELTLLDKLAIPRTQGDEEERYYAVRAIKRRLMLADPAIDFDRVLFIDIPFPAGSEWPHETRHRLGYMAVPGGRLMILKGLGPDGHVTKLMPQEPLHGTFWRPDLSFDGQRVLFSFHPANEKNFHLYEINIDGTGLRQITSGIYDDVDPVYLPDGEHLVFASTRGHNYVRCMPPTNSFTLSRCRLDGQGIYLISRNNEPDYLPALLNDGRVIYTRWEYTDKPLWRAQSLWTMNPDGTRAATYWGNQTVWPDLLKDARQIPGSHRVMFTGSAHHNWFAGSIGIVDMQKGLNFPDGLTKVTAELEWPESGNGPVDPVESPNYYASGRYEAYQNPYPLSPELFLVSASHGGKFVLYLMDIDGNRELIYEGAHHLFHAMPVHARRKPPVIPNMVQWPGPDERFNPAPGIIYSNNVYRNAPTELQGQAKYLRILTVDPKTYSYWYKRPYASTGPVVSMVASEGVKRILGTVPIESDGSVCFEAPSGRALYFQLLDDQQRALQTMRSISGVMPGETRGCLGCHEMHSVAPAQANYADALPRIPSTLTPPPWGQESVSYLRFVQPVLDRYCGKCHQGNGKARKTLDLTLRGDGLFKEPYPLLLGQPTWGAAYHPPVNPPAGFGIADTILVEAYDQRDPKAYQTPRPMTRLSYKSRLIEIASSGTHHKVKVDEVSRLRLIAWVDTMGPYRGDEEIRQIDDPDFQGIDWLSIRPQIKNAPVIVRPGPLDTVSQVGCR